MRHDQNLFAGVALDDFEQGCSNARSEGGQAFASILEGKAGVAAQETGVVSRETGLGLLVSQALEMPVVAFAQSRVGVDTVFGAGPDACCSASGALQVAAVGGRKALPRKGTARGLRLGDAVFVQFNVEMPLETPFGVPGGFSVTNNAESGEWICHPPDLTTRQIPPAPPSRRLMSELRSRWCPDPPSLRHPGFR